MNGLILFGGIIIGGIIADNVQMNMRVEELERRVRDLTQSQNDEASPEDLEICTDPMNCDCVRHITFGVKNEKKVIPPHERMVLCPRECGTYVRTERVGMAHKIHRGGEMESCEE